MATTAWSWTRTWSRYKCTSRREREQVIRTLRTGRPSERFTLMLMVLYWFVCDVFLSLFLWWHQWNQNDPKQTRSRRAYRKEPVLLKSVFTSRLWWWFCFACVHQSEQHHWLLHSPALMSTRSVSIAYVQLSTGRDAFFTVTSHLCRLSGRLISLTQAPQHTHLLSWLSNHLTPGPHAPACSVHERPSAQLHQSLRGASFLIPDQICADDSTFIFPDKYCRVVRLSVSRRNCPHVAPRISGSWSRWCSTTCRADCDGEVTRGALPCLVPELPRVVKRVVPGPSMTRQRIVKTHDLVETRPTPSWRPFGCCLPIKANRVICSNVGPTFPNHEEWSRIAAS